jgi:hypothetical protein
MVQRSKKGPFREPYLTLGIAAYSKRSASAPGRESHKVQARHEPHDLRVLCMFHSFCASCISLNWTDLLVVALLLAYHQSIQTNVIRQH